ncbi:MAG: NAAT family transporter [Gammaproteobacteria bacterium]|nr:NAAT family transporter [Gammaproteobacteria bacterium]MCP4088717.1 NAAT family transporter [Gammaproteobacteria bacterium]MCP4275240.1 NAAT family transporter [Gammaproteobacteria bacterium]MCP4830750.1 NAAT family transporter [Gammaproteobacteria bacterium]MCP4929539.1 NAAT family transporter [Gammaproteobacteria bacterium]
MDNTAVHFFTVFMAFFAIMNPVANGSLFIGLTQDNDSTARSLIALRAVAVAFIIVSAFAIGGREIFSIFGITLPAFRIAGGLMIGAIGYHMLQGEQSTLCTPSNDDNEKSSGAALDMAITPLGMPVLAGPGTIATAMNYTAESTVAEITRVLAAFGLMCFITFLAFIGGQWLAKVLGQNGIKVISRLMGLILAVIGVQMLIAGVRGAVAA